MRKIDWILLAIILGLLAAIVLVQTGCTVVHYREAWALSVLQTRTLEFSDATTSQTLTLRYNSAGDSATAGAIVEAAVKGAVRGAKP